MIKVGDNIRLKKVSGDKFKHLFADRTFIKVEKITPCGNQKGTTYKCCEECPGYINNTNYCFGDIRLGYLAMVSNGWDE